MKKGNWLRNLVLCFVVGLFAVSFSVIPQPAIAGGGLTKADFLKEAKVFVESVSPKDAHALMSKGYSVLDVRTKKEFKKGHIPGAKWLGRGLLEFKIANVFPEKDAKILVYCKSGGRATLSTYTLMKMGYTNVKNIAGGWKAWVKAGLPTE
ncbi:MAG: hypothetical protein J7J91_05935 [Deltaproteobacteria bacterium]|nr:hypothetical protein [Deltaproteobacteria bacterium]MCD6138104.1 hypothetical protein [Deltaproteobacteria bacterium]RLB93990.1 MAG: hypothetical protein DRH50_07050 [Deltaproteobacteria bacterium]RLC09758.1 MAG: hypothetical protein DRH43_07690 [Deltaproteobacteria bacterium]